jgi:preprotein translocase SecE subunit
VGRITGFLREAWQELKKVNWPTPEQARNLTVLVIAVSFVIGAFITAFDLIFGAIAGAIGAG